MTRKEIEAKLIKDLDKFEHLDTETFHKKFIGEEIGHGQYRYVYNLKNKLYKDYVVKFEQEEIPCCNITEYNLWSDLTSVKYFHKYFAPIIVIGRGGKVIVQRRVTFKSLNKYPKQVPAFFEDLKVGNFGWIGRQFVCSDYGNHRYTYSFTKRLKKVKEWRLDTGYNVNHPGL